MLRILDPEDQDDCDSSDDCGISETCIASGESGRQECVQGMAMHHNLRHIYKIRTFYVRS